MTPTPIRRWLRVHREAFPWPRIGEIMFDEPTRQLQVAAGLFALLSGWNAISGPIFAPMDARAVVYRFASPDTWGTLRVFLGLFQVACALLPRSRWRVKFVVAQVQVFLATYVVMAFGLTVGPSASPAMLWLLLVELWIAGRALYDRDMNGTDRRDRRMEASHGLRHG